LRVKAHFARTSLLTQALPPVAVDEANIVGLAKFETRCVVQEFRRTLNEDLLQAPFDVLLVDLLEERWPLVEIEGGAILWTEFAANSGAIAGREVKPVSRDAYGRDAFAKACAALARALKAKTSQARPVKVVLHRVWLAEGYRDEEGFHPFQDSALAYGHQVLPLIQSCEEDFLAAFPDALVVKAERQPVSDPHHRWGPALFHYTPDYYDEILTKIEQGLA
jgi:hypothetical protein